MRTVLSEHFYQGERKLPEVSNLPVNIESARVISKTLITRCPHCGQKFSDEGLNIAVFLYGIFFLAGSDHGYAGITCPTCLKTICHQDTRENILQVKKMLSEPIRLSDNEFDPKLRYFSSVGASPKDIPLIGDFDIRNLKYQMDGNKPPTMSEKILDCLKDNLYLEKTYLCSYIPDENEPAGTFCYVWWFKENEIKTLLDLENKREIKIFPRYYHHCALIEDVDLFCWKYGLLNKSFDDLKSHAIANQENLEKKLIREGIDLEAALDENPDILDSKIIELIQYENQTRTASDILDVPGDFLKILIADPEPWGVASSIGQLCKGFWKTKNPFTNVALPLTLRPFSPHPFKETAERQWLQQAKDDILPEFTKPYVQNYLMHNYASFIREYIEIIQNRSFCYADLWSLKEKYLKELDSIARDEKKLENKNLFYRKNGFWLISYYGSQSLIQNLDGFEYIHFLLQNKGKQFTYFNIEQLLNGEADKEKIEKENQNSEEDSNEDDKEEGEIDKGFLFSSLDQEMITPDLLSKIQTERNKISEQMNEAERNGDNEHFIELSSFLKQLDEHLKDYITVKESKKGGKKFIKIKRFKNSTAYKVKKDNVDRVIKYALNSLEEHNQSAYKHLKASIRNKSGEIWYEPEVDTDWFTG
jgi:hypothetical protein